MDPTLDLQAQIVALRTAVEGVWLSLLTNDPNRVANAETLRTENLKAIRSLGAPTPDAVAMRDAVARHTDQLWKSIVWQLGGEPQDD